MLELGVYIMHRLAGHKTLPASVAMGLTQVERQRQESVSGVSPDSIGEESVLLIL